ncbi:MAG: hypothetical protein H7061_12755 [Bdellovibrionaceae bacterium]|nr:hypothetical protein [Bdellovibrio sp.]
MKLGLALLFTLTFAIIGCRRASESARGTGATEDYVVLTEEQAKIYITPTIYNISVHNGTNAECPVSDLRDVKSPKGIVLAKVCASFLKKCILQGSCKVLVGDSFQLLHYSEKVNGEFRFSKVDESICRYSYGVHGVCVDPFYSVAADLSIYESGTVVFIPAAVGIILPDGAIHDGHFIVRDSGSKILGYGRFDFFTGYNQLDQATNPLVKLGLAWKGTHLPYYLITGDKAREVLNSRYYPSIPD